MDDFRSDPLWELLGRARRPEPSPWLATRIVAASRAQAARPRRGWAALVYRWLAVPAAAAAVVLAGIAIRHHHVAPTPEGAPLFAAFEAFADNSFEVDYLWDSPGF